MNTQTKLHWTDVAGSVKTEAMVLLSIIRVQHPDLGWNDRGLYCIGEPSAETFALVTAFYRLSREAQQFAWKEHYHAF